VRQFTIFDLRLEQEISRIGFSNQKSRPLQKWRSGFRQKAAFFNFQDFAAPCRDAATVDGWFCKGLKSSIVNHK
jgi:hypothetical protein